jgi:hypothetical protein
MHRESEKQSPVRDEYLRKDTEMSRSSAGRTETGRADETARERTAAPERMSPRGMSPADVARRAELTRHLPPSEFPADRARLLSRLQSRRVPDSVIDAVSGLPEGQEFQTLAEVVRAIGLRIEH